MKFRDHFEEMMKNPEIFDEYKPLEPEYEIIEQFLRARVEKNLTQKEQAEITGTPQGHISRIENGKYNPSLAYLRRLAGAIVKSGVWAHQAAVLSDWSDTRFPSLKISPVMTSPSSS